VVIIGAGPVGLAAAAHAFERNLSPLVLEAGASAGAGVLRWAHVRMFSPWRFNIDRAAAAILARHGWTPPKDDEYPTGGELVARYLSPLAETPEIAATLRPGMRVLAVSRVAHDRMKDTARDDAPYIVRATGPAGEEDILARAVIDASGTIESPGPLGASGLPAIGERAHADRIFYGIPDVLGRPRTRYANRRILIVGSGHSACNVLVDLSVLAREAPETRVVWAIRRPGLERLAGGLNDQLEERGKLGLRVARLVEERIVALATGFHLDRLTATPDGVVAHGNGRSLAPVDEIVAATGFRPDWSILSEVRLDLHPSVGSPTALALLIDPNVHSCGTFPPHGAEELRHPDGNFFVIGMKSYGRAPTFLMLTGYEQARSVVCAIAGDWDAARRVELVLPETGVSSLDPIPGEACCGLTERPAPLATALPLLATDAAPGPGCCGSTTPRS
jgi:thioredoxin reductase